jgi:hypothetical protein
LLEAALVGYRIEAERITKAIEDIRSRLKGHVPPPSAKPAQRALSAAARKRIVLAETHHARLGFRLPGQEDGDRGRVL